MQYRTLVMYMEIGCFVSCLCGWILICSTLAIEYWTWSEVGSVVLTTSNYYSNLWMDCISDTTGVSDCKYYPSLLALSVFLHVCRALAIVSVILGFWAAVLALIGMKCTKIGGSEMANARVTFAASVTYLACGFSGMIVYSWWGNKVRSEFVDPNFRAQKFEIGAAVFIGWGGSCLVIAAASVMCYFSGREVFYKNGQKQPRSQPRSYAAGRPRSYVTARTRTYMLPGSSRPALTFSDSPRRTPKPTPVPPLFSGQVSLASQETRSSRTKSPRSRDSFV
ncbi:claudin-10 [Sardina pilchardus]|uniref:claudin-10 n=1 Tax=Sardina pilchardus TaxID=27697 RepID=UPI002E0E1276